MSQEEAITKTESMLDFASDDALDQLIQQGDFSGLTMRQRSQFCYWFAKRLGLNPATKPFQFIVLNNIVTLYATKTCSDQLRRNNNLSDEILYEGPLHVGDEQRKDVYMVKVRIKDPNGRTEDAIGCLGIGNLKDEALANAVMKCHTKALRRGTLSFCGLGLPDETEIESVKGLEGGEGFPRLINPPPQIFPQESFAPPASAMGGNRSTPLPAVHAEPVKKKETVATATSLPRAQAPSAQPAAPKLPSVLPAVKP